MTDDVRSVDPASPAGLDVYVPIFQAYAGDAFFVLRTASPAALAPALSGAVRSVDPDQSIFDVQSMTARIAERIWQPRAAATILTLFSFAAWLLASVGIYATVSSSVAQRTREIGIRLTLGAAPRDVWRLTMRQALLPVVVAAALGALAAFGLSRWLEGTVFGLAPIEAAYLTVPLLVVAVAGAACLAPARRAAGLDPLAALRHE